MTKDEAQKRIEDKVIWGLVDSRTLSPPGREIVLHFQDTPADQPILIEALFDFLTNQQFTTSERVENVAYLVVNFGNRELLNQLVSKLTEGEAPDEFHIRMAMAAIRSFPAFDAGRDDAESQGKSDFLPFLINCLRDKKHTSLAYEILSQFYPEDMISYFLWALGHHSNDLTLVEYMLTDLYFDHRKEAPGVLALEVIRDVFSRLSEAVQKHPLLPDYAKKRLATTVPSKCKTKHTGTITKD